MVSATVEKQLKGRRVLEIVSSLEINEVTEYFPILHFRVRSLFSNFELGHR